MKNPLQTFVRLAGDLITDFLNASLFLYHIQRRPFHHQRIAFRMFEALDFEVYVQLRPFDGVRSCHAHVERTADAGIAQPIIPCALIINTLTDVGCKLLFKVVSISFY